MTILTLIVIGLAVAGVSMYRRGKRMWDEGVWLYAQAMLEQDKNHRMMADHRAYLEEFSVDE